MAYRGYLICWTLLGEVFIEKGAHLIGWATGEADAKRIIDSLLD